MRADYDSQGDTLAIELEPVERLDHGDNEVHDQAVAGILDDRIVSIDVLGAREDVEEPLRAIAEHYSLNFDELLAVARAALALPDREVDLHIGEPA